MISIVIPVFNEQAVLKQLCERLAQVMPNVGDYEIIFVNDGSNDDSLNILKDLASIDSRYKVLNFSRNFGQQPAYAAGLRYAKGDAVIMMDADLQDPPELIADFIKKWQEGYKIVYGIRTKRNGESFFKKITASIFYWLINKLSPTPIPPQASDFRLLDKKVVDEINQLEEYHLFLRGITVWAGFKQTSVEFIREKRCSGNTKYNYKRMMALAIDGICSFSIKPLRLGVYLGFTTSLCSFLLLLAMILEKIFLHAALRGWTSLITTILFLGGVQLFSIGILGEYIGRIYEQTKKRPLYVIQDKIGL